MCTKEIRSSLYYSCQRVCSNPKLGVVRHFKNFTSVNTNSYTRKLVFHSKTFVNNYRATRPGISSFRTPTIPTAFLTKIYQFSVIFDLYECVF